MNLKLIFSLLVILAISIVGCQSNNNSQVKSEINRSSDGDGKVAQATVDSNDESTVEENDLPKEKVEPNKSSEADKGDKIETIYTDLKAEKCKTIESNEEEGWIEQECSGVAGYKLEVTEGDLRQTINVITPSGKKHELDFQQNVSYAFSFIGEKAEWRVKKVGGKITPIALIVRLSANEDPENPSKITSYLVVTKLERESVCITDVIKPIKNANEKARESADTSAGKPCLKSNK